MNVMMEAILTLPDQFRWGIDLDPVPIDADRPIVLLPDRGAYQGSHLVERVIEIGRLGVVATGTGICEQVPDELTRAQAGVLD